MLIKFLSAFFVAFAVAAASGLFIVPFLKRVRMSEKVREDGPVWHRSKEGTPIMGGFIFIVGVLAACFTVGLQPIKEGNFSHLMVLGFALVNGAIGFVDDYVKMLKKRNMGLTAMQKLILQVAASVAFVLLLRLGGHLSPNLYIPFFGVTWKLPEIVYLLLSVFIMVGCVNAVNITDGVDGLASGATVPVALCYAAIAAAWGYMAQGVFAAALAGGVTAFLLYNFHPAKVFMGDTGSLFLGGAVCAMAFAMDMPLILVILGIVYILETLSDIIQVFYFKLTHGKRFFKMAPLHHHLELCGWNEYKIFAVATAVSAAAAVISYLAMFDRYGI